MLSYLNPLPSLPAYLGPHKVGTSEFEIPITEIPSSTAIPDSRIKTIKFRLYYPTTPNITFKEPVYWLPSPQKQWNEAYASFMGASERYASLLTNMLGLWNYTKLPAVKNAPLLPPRQRQGHPVCIFSHGLGGNCNTYSSIVGSLASCGVICVAPEHRDGSSPISFVRDENGQIETTIEYQKHSHAPSPQVLNARNAQLRIRLAELDLTYTVIKAMNEGKRFTNLASETGHDQPELINQLNLHPGGVVWSGHSFGAATITQFVKSVFYHDHLPRLSSKSAVHEEDVDGWDRTPIYQTTPDSDIVKQITPESPVALLDCWTMPLRGESTMWLWSRPMPSYSRQADVNTRPNTVAVMSAEFYRWTDLLNRTRALLSQSPNAAVEAFEQQKKRRESEAPSVKGDKTRATNPIPELSKEKSESTIEQNPTIATVSEDSSEPSPTHSHSISESSSAQSSNTSLHSGQTDDKTAMKPGATSSIEPHLYHIPQSAHLSQSDFGVLFPNLTKYVMKAIEPEETVKLNVRAISAVIRNVGLPVETLVGGEDHILEFEKMSEAEKGTRKKLRWLRVPLLDA